MSSGTPKSFRSRMGTVARRSSSLLSLGRDKDKDRDKERERSSSPARSISSVGHTPSASASEVPAVIQKTTSRPPSIAPSESSSAEGGRSTGGHPTTPGIDTAVSTLAPPAPSDHHLMPSPIAESPLSEEAATAEDVRGRTYGKSPLGQEVTASPQAMVPSNLEASNEAGKEGGEKEKEKPKADQVVYTEEPEEMKETLVVEGGGNKGPEKKDAEVVPQQRQQTQIIPPHEQPTLVASPVPVADAPSYFEIQVTPKPEPFTDSESLKKAIQYNTMGEPAQERDADVASEGMLSSETTPRPHVPVVNVVEATPIPSGTPVANQVQSAPPPVQIAQVVNERMTMPVPQTVAADMSGDKGGAGKGTSDSKAMPIPQVIAVAPAGSRKDGGAEGSRDTVQAAPNPKTMPVPQVVAVGPAGRKDVGAEGSRDTVQAVSSQKSMPMPQVVAVDLAESRKDVGAEGSRNTVQMMPNQKAMRAPQVVAVDPAESRKDGGVDGSRDTAQAAPKRPTAIPISSYVVESPQGIWGNSKQDAKAAGGAGSEEARPLEDPFADPTPSRAPTISTMPEAEPAVESEQPPQEPQVVVMPLPPLEDVVRTSKPIRVVPSVNENLSRAYYQPETDERKPLLRPQDPPLQSYLQPGPSHQHAAGPLHLNISSNSEVPSVSSSAPVPWPHMKTAATATQATASMPRLHHLGWIEYSLPDATVYYVHPTLRVTTDVDLRSVRKLDGVTRYLEHRRDNEGRGTPSGYELWLRNAGERGDGGKGKKGKKSGEKEIALLRSWVDHKRRMVTSDPIWDTHGDGRRKRMEAADDALDMEYRYWAFMEGHPAHTALPANARVDSMDVLTWAWSDRLLPSQKAIPPPFTQEECQELMNVLRSFGDNAGDSGLQTVVHTRVVSRILMRVGQWRQTHFRPHKPLPQDVGSRRLGITPRQSPKFGRVLFDILLSTFFLGIPYLFLTRMNSRYTDEETGMLNMQSAGPMLMIGACTCLVAAVVLSASVTFLSLPGLDNIGRVAGLIAVLLATFSMVTSVVALFRYKADMEYASSILAGPGRFGGEGLMLHSLSGRVVIFSLPLVLLIYAVVSFVTGIVLYSFLGVSETKVGVLQRHFEEYTRWTVVGVLGGLGGVLLTSMLLLQRR